MTTPSLPDLNGLLLTPHERQRLSGARSADDLSDLSRRVLGRDVVVEQDLRAAAAGHRLDPDAASRALAWVETLSSGVNPSMARPARVDHPGFRGAAVLSDASRIWWLLEEHTLPGVPRAVRLDPLQELTEDQGAALDGMVRYAIRSCGPGRTYGPYDEPGTDALIWHIDTSEGRRHLHLQGRFIPRLRSYLAEGGTPRRKADGRRLIRWDGPEQVLIYVDDVQPQERPEDS